jgi:hypothetical protein
MQVSLCLDPGKRRKNKTEEGKVSSLYIMCVCVCTKERGKEERKRNE